MNSAGHVVSITAPQQASEVCSNDPYNLSHHYSYTSSSVGCDDLVSESGASVGRSSASTSHRSREDVPLCPQDTTCTEINNPNHQMQYMHTCRLTPCYHINVSSHRRFFNHTSEQEKTEVERSGPSRSQRAGKSRRYLAGVTFKHISSTIPNAQKITVMHCMKAYEIHGDWTKVKLHTLKRYLHQVIGVHAAQQQLHLEFKQLLADELANLSELGVKEGSTLRVTEISEDSVVTLRVGQQTDQAWM